MGWYGAAVSLGLLSLLLGFALQAPITSFFAWIYILARAPYRVGDRIRIGDSTGDVIDVGYLDTTLWEVGGEFLSSDHPSGRIIRFPNSTVFNTSVFNYSWPLFPYIWNEITVQVAYQSDLELVAKVMTATVEEEIGSRMEERVRIYRGLLAETPVDHFDVSERPSVIFRVNPITWVDATVRYLVAPRQRRPAQDGADETDHRTAQRRAGPGHVPCGEHALSRRLTRPGPPGALPAGGDRSPGSRASRCAPWPLRPNR